MYQQHSSIVGSLKVFKSPVIMLGFFSFLFMMDTIIPCCYAAEVNNLSLKYLSNIIEILQDKLEKLEKESDLLKKKQENFEEETTNKLQVIQQNFKETHLQFVNINENLVNRTKKNDPNCSELGICLNILKEQFVETNLNVSSERQQLDNKTHNCENNFQKLNQKFLNYRKLILEISNDKESSEAKILAKLLENSFKKALIEKNQSDFISFIINLGFDINIQDSSKETYLHRAAFNGNSDIVTMLIKHGANVEAKENYGRTPLSWASDKGHLAVVTELIKNGANLENCDNYNWSPLDWAADRGHVLVVNELLKNGANIENKDVNGITALHWASQKGRLSVVTLLIKYGANINSKTNTGKTPLNFAHASVVDELIKHGAKS